MEYRIEKDTMGEMKVPADRYWGAQTQRSGMVGKNCDLEILARALQVFVDGSEYLFIDKRD